ncbi:hypothetical protein YC2023_034610 [Brassica napus]
MGEIETRPCEPSRGAARSLNMSEKFTGSSATLVQKCLELGKLVSNSGVLDKAWSKISAAHGNQVSGLEFKPYHEGIYTIVVFVAPSFPFDSAASTPLSGPEGQNPFHFLRSENIFSFSLHKPAYQLFVSANKNNLTELKLELLGLLKSKKHVIITGAALGGSVASLFTLWLLESVEPNFKRPLCITFGSPLLGDASLQQILENSLWNSCFLHVVADAAQTPVNTNFKPFGTFLIWVGSQCVCIDDPVTVTELLGGANADEIVWRDYSEVLGRLVQPVAVETRLMVDDGVFNRMAERAENKKPRFDPLIKLNDMKIHMIYFEWYKKICKKMKIGYYDHFKTQLVFSYENRRRELNDYWKELVEEVEKTPQSEKSLLKTRSLLSGHNYRRMIEPLDIATYYRDGGKEYRNSRPRHYVTLEKWFKAGVEDEKIPSPARPPGSDLSDLLTFDSCFWADVQEAMRVTDALALKTQVVGREELLEKLMRFEEYVGEMLKKREVSPEIFLEGSSFMKWWREYKEIRALHSPPSYFTQFMIQRKYESYGKPADKE